ncbi:MAG: phosphoglycerate kinase [Patescibacteria group bacterium]
MISYLRRVPASKLRGTALLRLDFNTEDDWRMKAVLPTIKFLLRHADKIIIVSHKGRPQPSLIRSNGRIGEANKKLSLAADAKTLSRLLGKKVHFVSNFNFLGIKQMVNAAPKSSVFLLENLRFLKGEEQNSRELAKDLACLADYYVNDAFAVSHRENASVVAITKLLPSYAGLEFEKEIDILSRVMKKPKKPLVLVLGGGKAADKMGAIQFFKNKATNILLGGAPANTIYLLEGADIKKSLADRNPDDLKRLRRIIKYKNLVLPLDFIFHNNSILDVGQRTMGLFALRISKARTIIWSGPLGLIEKKPYDRGSLAIAKSIAQNRKAFSLAGGGETVMFLKKHGLDKKFSFISTGGGAMLDFLAGKKLPGIEALRK